MKDVTGQLAEIVCAMAARLEASKDEEDERVVNALERAHGAAIEVFVALLELKRLEGL